MCSQRDAIESAMANFSLAEPKINSVGFGGQLVNVLCAVEPKAGWHFTLATLNRSAAQLAQAPTLTDYLSIRLVARHVSPGEEFRFWPWGNGIQWHEQTK